jgi:hypothetical protein
MNRATRTALKLLIPAAVVVLAVGSRLGNPARVGAQKDVDLVPSNGGTVAGEAQGENLPAL